MERIHEKPCPSLVCLHVSSGLWCRLRGRGCLELCRAYNRRRPASILACVGRRAQGEARFPNKRMLEGCHILLGGGLRELPSVATPERISGSLAVGPLCGGSWLLPASQQLSPGGAVYLVSQGIETKTSFGGALRRFMARLRSAHRRRGSTVRAGGPRRVGGGHLGRVPAQPQRWHVEPQAPRRSAALLRCMHAARALLSWQ